MTKIIPRDYQEEASESVFSYFNKNYGNPVIAMPTGTGKSLVIAMIITRMLKAYHNQKILALTDSKELIIQNYNQLLRWWQAAPVGINCASLNKRDFRSKIIIGAITSVYKHWAQFGKVDIILVDEAHTVSLVGTKMYKQFIQNLLIINPALKVIGLTATPYRLGSGLIVSPESIFTDFCFNVTDMGSFNRFIQEGYMSMLIPKKTELILDTTSVKITAGDFNEKQLQIAVDKYEITYEALKETVELGGDRKHWLIFASGIEHCNHICEILAELGVECLPIHSKLFDKERDLTWNRFISGNLRAVVNNNCLTTGVDYAEIDLIVILRPTTSPGLWVQILGRGTRPFYAKGYDLTTIEGRFNAMQDGGKENCLVLDFAGNTSRLGPINDPVIPKVKGDKGGTAPVKICESCNTYNHASVRICACCGAEFKFTVGIKEEASKSELIKVDLPIVETFPVDHITYHEHKKLGGLVSLKVTYFSGLRTFTEYVCFEHTGNARLKAEEWWKERGGIEVPNTVLLAKQLVETLKKPVELRVWVNKKYPEIMKPIFIK